MKNYMLSEELANKIIAYLSEKPFKESAALIGELMQMKEVNILTPEMKGGNENVQKSETKSQESNADDQQT